MRNVVGKNNSYDLGRYRLIALTLISGLEDIIVAIFG